MRIVELARTELVEAMLAGISYKQMSFGTNIPWDRLSGFANYGLRIEDEELRSICDYIAQANPRQERLTEKSASYFGKN